MRDIIYFFKLLAEERYCRELTLWKLFKQAIITQVLMIWENMLFQNCRIYALSLHIKMYSVGNQIQMDVNVLKTDMSHLTKILSPLPSHIPFNTLGFACFSSTFFVSACFDPSLRFSDQS